MATNYTIPADIATKTGPVLIGAALNFCLMGVLAVQCYIYYLAFPRDGKMMKGLVVFMLLAEITQTCITMEIVFRLFGRGYGNPTELNAVGLNWLAVPIFTSTISCMTQNFFGWRIWRLSGKSIYIPVLILLLSLMQFSAGIAAGVASHQIDKFSLLTEVNHTRTSVWLMGTAACDVIITISMSYYLLRSRTGFHATNALIAKFVQITVGTGLVCAAFAIVEISTFLALGSTNYHLAPAGVLSKLYSNSLLVVLNARVSIVGGRDMTSEGATAAQMSTWEYGLNIKQTNSTVPALELRNINVNVSQVTSSDAYAKSRLGDDHPKYNSSLDMSSV